MPETEFLTLAQTEAEVTIWAQGGYETGAVSFPFTFHASSEWSAKMLLWHLRHRMATLLERTRTEAYADGWKDAKGHKPKRTWTSSRWAV